MCPIQERKLATIRKIQEVKPITGADKICAYRVDGWWVVDQVGKYTVGDLVVYLEVDSWVSTEIAPFLSKGKEPREYEGVKGERLRTIRLKGQLSQGLLLPPHEVIGCGCYTFLKEGEDVTEWLGILKWERPINAQLAGLIRGNFPPEIPKTSQERIQNLTREFEDLKKYTWVATEKLDGTSCTFYLDKEGEFHVCSRNLDLKRDENNLYWKMAIDLDIESRMRANDLFGVALQGEVVGEGVQGNQYKCKPRFYLFDVYRVGVNYLSYDELRSLAKKLEIERVPFIMEGNIFRHDTIEDLLTFAEGESRLNDSQREGLVYQCLEHPEKSFKVISNAWLLGNE